MSRTARRLMSAVVAIALVFPAHFPTAIAEMITTEAALGAANRHNLLTEAETFFLQDKVAAQLSQLGVDQNHVLARVRSMTSHELTALARKMDSMPAGAGAIEIIGIVFLVLLILEIVGVTDIFKKI